GELKAFRPGASPPPSPPLTATLLSCIDWLTFMPALEGLRAPQEIYRRIDQQFHYRGSDHAANHRRRDSFHHVGAGPVAPENWRQTGNDDTGRHGFGPDALHRPVVNGVSQINDVAHQPSLFPVIMGDIEVEEHDDTGLGIK